MECGACTFCCLVLPVPSLDKAAGERCAHCDTGKGCLIWGTKPEECSSFRCAYHQAPKCSPDMRPDNCRVLFERKGKIMIGTMHPWYGRDGLRKEARSQIASFMREGLSVILFSKKDKPTVLPAGDKTFAGVWAEYQAGE